MPVQILFVDDDPFLLQAQRRLLFRVKEWKSDFCESGKAALEHLENQAYDVVVSDMRMPEMNGAELFREVRLRFPDCVRIMLSGQTESGTLCRTFGPSHQYLQKPCPPEELRQAVDRSLALHERLNRDNALRTIHELKISDIAESRLKVIRTCRTASTTKASLVDQIATDTGWAAAFDCMARRLRPDVSADCEPLALTELVQPLDLAEVRPLAAASCVFAHLCSEFSPYTDVAENTLDVAVQTARDGVSDLPSTASWDVAQWARSRTTEEMTLASLLHNVANLLPFKHPFRTQFLSGALLEHLGLPHSVVANVAARSARESRVAE